MLTPDQIIEITQNILKKTGFIADVRIIEGGFGSKSIQVISIESDDDLSMLIGKNGQNLSALEHIIKLVVGKQMSDEEGRGNFVVDVNNYRETRTKFVLDIAQNVAQRVLNTQKAEALSPMSAYERRIVHTELASNKGISTESIGEEPRRRVVIKPLDI